MQYDVIVVGAGPAGCAAAYDLAAAGKHVLMIDRRRFPRAKPCAGGVTIKALRRLRYPISPVVRQVCTDLVAGKRLESSETFHSRHPICAMTVRQEFDDYCLHRTIDRGVEFRVVPHFNAIVENQDGVIIESSEGVLCSRYLVGADGANSVVRRALPAFGAVERGFAIEAQVSMRCPPPLEMDFGVVELGYGWLFPKGDHINVGLYTNSPTLRLDRDALSRYATAKLGPVELQHVVGHHIGLQGWRGPLASSRVVLAGDAAGLVDPLLGEGIHNAVASGQAAAAAIASTSESRSSLAAAYARELRPILHDVRASYRDAARFYSNLEVGYRALTSRVVRYALMKGYAQGMTFSSTKRWFFLLPLLPHRASLSA